MAKTIAALETVLREHKLDSTLSSTPGRAWAPPGVTPTGIAPLDACLRGGLPRGQVCEIAGPPSSGRTTLLLQLLADVTGRGEIAALVDTGDRLDVAAAAAGGIDLTRLLWVRGEATTCPGEPATVTRVVRPPTGSERPHTADRALERALKALHLVLQAGGFTVVAIDLADVPLAALKRLPFTTWLRLQRAVEGRDTTCVLVVPEPLARSAGGLTVALAARAAWTGEARGRRLSRLTVTARVSSPRQYAGGEAAFGARVVDEAADTPAGPLPAVAVRPR